MREIGTRKQFLFSMVLLEGWYMPVFTNRSQILGDINLISQGLSSQYHPSAIAHLKKGGILKPAFTGADLSSVSPTDIKIFRRTANWENTRNDLEALKAEARNGLDALFERSQSEMKSQDSLFADSAPMLEDIAVALAGHSGFKSASLQTVFHIFERISEGSQIKTDSAEEIINKLLEASNAIISDLNELDSNLADNHLRNARDASRRVAEKMQEYLSGSQEGKNIETFFADAKLREDLLLLRHALQRLVTTQQPHDPKLKIQIMALVSIGTSALFVASLLAIFGSPDLSLVERGVAWAVNLSLLHFIQQAVNYMYILLRTETRGALRLPSFDVSYNDAPGMVERRVSNKEFIFPALLSVLYNIFKMGGKYLLNLFNDSSNSNFMRTSGGVLIARRVEKTTYIIQDIIDKAGIHVDPRTAREISLMLSMPFEREAPIYLALLETTQELNMGIGRPVNLSRHIGEAGGEFSAYRALLKIVEKHAPQLMPIIKDPANELLNIAPNLTADIFLSNDLFEVLDRQQERCAAAAATQFSGCKDALYAAIRAEREEFYRRDLVESARNAGFSDLEAGLWAEKFILRAKTDKQYKIISSLGWKLRGGVICPDEMDKLVTAVAVEFCITKAVAASLLDIIGESNVDIRARGLNREFDHSGNLGQIAEWRMLARVVTRKEKDDLISGEECNAKKLYEHNQEFKALVAQVSGKQTEDIQREWINQEKQTKKKADAAEKISQAISDRGIDHRISAYIADEIMTFAAKNEPLGSVWVSKIEEVIREKNCSWWVADELVHEKFLNEVEAEVRRLSVETGLNEEEANRACDVVSDALSTIRLSVNVTAEGYMNIITSELDGMRSISYRLERDNKLPGVISKKKRIEDKLKNSRDGISALIPGSQDLDIPSVLVDAVETITTKMLGQQRAEKRFPDGVFGGSIIIAGQVADVIFEEELLHVSMPSQEESFEPAPFEVFNIANPSENGGSFKIPLSKEARETLIKIKNDAANPENYYRLKVLLIDYAKAIVEREDLIEEIRREIVAPNARPLELRATRTKEEDGRATLLRRGQELKLQKRIIVSNGLIASLEKDIKNSQKEEQRKENDKKLEDESKRKERLEGRLRETQVLSDYMFAPVAKALYDKDGALITNGIINQTIIDETKSYGIGQRGENNNLLEAVFDQANELSAIINQMIIDETKSYGIGQRGENNNLLEAVFDQSRRLSSSGIARYRIDSRDVNLDWGSGIIFERMSRNDPDSPYEGSKPSQWRRDIGYSPLTRLAAISVNFIHSLQQRSSSSHRILYDLERDFCSKVEFHPNVDRNAQTIEKGNIFPAKIGEALAIALEDGKTLDEAITGLINSWNLTPEELAVIMENTGGGGGSS